MTVLDSTARAGRAREADDALAPKVVRERQSRALTALLDHVHRGSPFYRDRLAQAGLDPGRPDPLEWLEQVPFTTREDLEREQAAHPPFGGMACLGLGDAALVARSGVGFSFSGRRLNVVASHRDVQRHGAVMRRALREGGLGAGDRIYLADDPRYNAVSVYAVRAATDLGATMVYVAAERTVRNARFVARVLPAHAYFLAPTYALHLAEVLAQEGRKDLPIKALIGWGEPGFSLPGWRARVRQAWAPIVADPDFRIVDVYAMSEAGVLAHGCAQARGLHCPPDSVLVEVVDVASGLRARPGERGEVVVTHLVPLGLPLVRYRTGDTAVLMDGCPCGWGHAALGGLERIADLVRAGDRTVSASEVEEEIGALLPSAAFRIVREDGARDLHLEIASAEAWDAGAVERQLASSLHVPVRVARLDPADLPPFRHRRLRVMDAGNAALHAELHQDDVDLE
jgi:phenylacetate-CoA ligase